MFPTSALKAISTALKAFPGVSDEAKKQLMGLVSGQLHKLDLVSREEFEMQRQSLERTREILTQLQQRIDQLEQQQDTG